MPRAQIKDEKAYQELRKHGESEEKSARIATLPPQRRARRSPQKGGKSPSYSGMSKQGLLRRARKIGINGRSSMSKKQLIDALCYH